MDRAPSLRLALWLLLAPVACAHPPPAWLTDADREIRLCEPGAATERVQLQYLGSGGVLLRRGGTALMTPPFYSNPPLYQVGLGIRLVPDEGRIERGLPRVDDVRAVLVGHGHYDHLMDLPVVLRHLPPDVVVYGNDTTRHLLAPWLPDERRVALNARRGSWKRPGEWIRVAGTPFRFMALESDHSPHMGPIELYQGVVEQDVTEPPSDANEWPEGETLAFLIDVLRDDGSVLLRLHYQDAASRAPAGFPPPVHMLDTRPVDVEILTVGGYATVDAYPEAITLRLSPRHAVLAHWEDFFLAPDRGPRVLRTTDLDAFVHRLERVLPADAGWTLPAPGVSLWFDACRSATPDRGAGAPGRGVPSARTERAHGTRHAPVIDSRVPRAPPGPDAG